MNDPELTYEELTQRFVAWAQVQPDIRAAIVVGSRTRVDRPADEWSDLDITVIATDPERYLRSADWVANIGNYWVTFLERTGSGEEMERRVLFEGGFDVNFALLADRNAKWLIRFLRLRRRFPGLLRIVLPRTTRQGIEQQVAGFTDLARRGIRVLLDKDGIADHLTLIDAETPSPRRPTLDEFLELVNDFWYHVVWTVKKLWRGDVSKAQPFYNLITSVSSRVFHCLDLPIE